MLTKDDMVQMLRNNPPDVAIRAYAEEFLREYIRMFQRQREMRSIILNDSSARDLVVRHFFNRALRAVHADQPRA